MLFPCNTVKQSKPKSLRICTLSHFMDKIYINNTMNIAPRLAQCTTCSAWHCHLNKSSVYILVTHPLFLLKSKAGEWDWKTWALSEVWNISIYSWLFKLWANYHLTGSSIPGYPSESCWSPGLEEFLDLIQVWENLNYSGNSGSIINTFRKCWITNWRRSPHDVGDVVMGSLPFFSLTITAAQKHSERV